MIDQFRAEKCVDMHKKHGDFFTAFDACLEFMKEICRPGRDKRMDGDKGERTTGQGFCSIFFPDRGEKDTDGDGVTDKKDAFPEDPKETKDTDGDGIGDNADKDDDNDGFPDDQDEFPKDPYRHVANTPPNYNQPNATDIDGDGYIGAQDAFPHDPLRHEFQDGNVSDPKLEELGQTVDGYFHMDESLGAQEQGFTGHKVAHNDQSTWTGDWLSEFGPGSKTSEEELRKLCKDNTRSMNWWCFKYGHGLWHSAARRGHQLSVFSASVLPVLLSLLPVLLPS